MKVNSVYAHGLQPPLKWAGGKRWLLSHLKPLWEPYAQYRLVEPLCGGLAVALGLLPANALLNDSNVHLINFFRWIQKGLSIDIPMEYDKDLYYDYRDRFNKFTEEGKENTREAAELFYYLNRTGYNGLCRFNKKGGYNVPFGRYKKINYIREYESYREVFQRWEFSSVDFEQLSLDKSDFIYADPPYDVEFTQYSKDGFDWDDQVRLAKWLSRHPGPVILSNQATERIVELYLDQGFKIKYLDAPRLINCTGDRTPVKEVLAMKAVSGFGSAR